MFETLKDFIVEEFGLDADKITMDATLTGDLGINSIEIFEFIEKCEEKFDISFGEDDISAFNTVGDVVNFIESKK